MQRKPKAWQERMIKIIEENNKIPKNWKIALPDFESHYEEIGHIDDAIEESEGTASVFWEEE
tara:strand:+ start:186 stop:371 length:186 start_codon:yes stop_codon:yes gene_type:complete